MDGDVGGSVRRTVVSSPEIRFKIPSGSETCMLPVSATAGPWQIYGKQNLAPALGRSHSR
jgi:hypothetical protein